MYVTPEFIRWSIPGDCSLREEMQPEQSERELRPLRAFSEAVSAQRLFEGICMGELSDSEPVSPADVKGFCAEEVLDAYGGKEYVMSQCGNCSINAIQKNKPNTLAGCYGLFSFGEMKDELFAASKHVFDEPLAEKLKQLFLPTEPTWYGIWAESPLSQPQLNLLCQLLKKLSVGNATLAEHLEDLLAAVETALVAKAPLYVSLGPAGHVEGEHWIVVPHCPVCKAFWPGGQRVCGVCKLHGHPLPSQKRHVRGDRPYWRLERFLGKSKTVAFLSRYQAFRRTISVADEKTRSVMKPKSNACDQTNEG